MQYCRSMADCLLSTDTVRVRWLSLHAEAGLHLPRWLSMLDSDEAARADRFHFAHDRETFIAAHALARAMLSEAAGLPTAAWRYVYGPFGKPEIAPCCGDHGLHFNISHTRGMAACAVARDLELGLDVEATDRPTEIDGAMHYFAPEEAGIVQASPEERRRAQFFRLWTLKEAFIKATGEGLTRPLDSFAFSLDVLRIAFYPERADVTRDDDPADWQFAEYRPAPHRQLALALRRRRSHTMHLDVRAARPGEVAPH